jgi:hypothetical protein
VIPTDYLALLAKCLLEQTDCKGALPLAPALAAATAAAAAVTALVPVIGLLLRNMREAGAGPLADVVAAMAKEEEAAQVALEAARIKAPAWQAYTAVTTFQVALDAAATYYARACTTVNTAVADRAADVERSRMQALAADETAAAALAADLLRIAEPMKRSLAGAVAQLTPLRRPEIAAQLQALVALHGAIETGEAALRTAAAADTIIPMEILRRALNLSSKQMQGLCAQVLAHEAGVVEDGPALEASRAELKQLLATAKAAVEAATAAASGAGGDAPTASLARLDARNLQAERDLAAANETVTRLKGKLAGVRERLKRARLQDIMAGVRATCAEVAAFQKQLRQLQKTARHLHAATAKHQESTNFQLDVGEQSRGKCVARSAAEFNARRKGYVAALLTALRGILGSKATFSAARRAAAEARLGAAFHSASLTGTFPPALHDRFYALWRDLCRGNEALIQARLAVLYAHVFAHVQRVETAARETMLRGERA